MSYHSGKFVRGIAALCSQFCKELLPPIQIPTAAIELLPTRIVTNGFHRNLRVSAAASLSGKSKSDNNNSKQSSTKQYQ
eukprot:3906154-Amphidinium_carterae.1